MLKTVTCVLSCVKKNIKGFLDSKPRHSSGILKVYCWILEQISDISSALKYILLCFSTVIFQYLLYKLDQPIIHLNINAGLYM